eukprot:scaffold4074_cov149-Skeletonema_menzelii.AAC.5
MASKVHALLAYRLRVAELYVSLTQLTTHSCWRQPGLDDWFGTLHLAKEAPTHGNWNLESTIYKPSPKRESMTYHTERTRTQINPTQRYTPTR